MPLDKELRVYMVSHDPILPYLAIILSVRLSNEIVEMAVGRRGFHLGLRTRRARTSDGGLFA